ncbi:MAG TPA: type II toxin-antitoxin system HipA family toxin [Patescibacteria group bacterium]|nr:type II toxin-antitoxin system HipA family toxin [Patescibacteria group bacterium]
MSSDEELVVILDAPELGPARPVGVLTRHPGPRGSIAFSYARSWLEAADGFALEPRLPLVEGPQYAPGAGLPAIFTDLAPDLWGRLLLERREAERALAEGRRPRRLGDWEFLVGVADETRMGALRLRRGVSGPYVADDAAGVPPLASVRTLEAAARAFEEGQAGPLVGDPAISMLIAPGSSLGGGRPKANVRDPDGSLWIAKFPSRTDRRDSGAWELVLARLARAAEIDVADTELLTLGGPGRTFTTRRFDRTAAGRRLYASAMTMAGRRDGEPAGYPDLAQAISRHVAHTAVRDDLAQLFRRLVFNVLAGNRDDHLRNHGFLRSAGGWRLAPAFDLNPAREMREHSLAIDGAVTAPSLEAALATHRLYGLTEEHSQGIVAEVGRAVAGWEAEARSLGIAAAERATAGAVIRTPPAEVEGA